MHPQRTPQGRAPPRLNPLRVPVGTGDDVALKIQMAMEEAQAAAALGSVGHNASMQRA